MKHILLLGLVLTALAACDKQPEKTPAQLSENNRGTQSFEVTNFDDGNWFIKDPGDDGLEGVSSEKAIADFNLKHQRKILVAVIDSGVDINHEDLQGKIWTNPGESGTDAKGNDKATNGLDDDSNGYIDDVHGWNFLGGKDGKSVSSETLEVTRELVRYEARIKNGEALTKNEKVYFEKVKAAYNEQRSEADEVLKDVAPEEVLATAAKATLKDKLGLEDYSKAALDAIDSKEQDIIAAKDVLLALVTKYRSVERFYRIYKYYSNITKYYLNKTYNPRAEIIGDDPSDFSQTNYGNNDVQGPDASHGTHVSGIIAAVRNNGIGINGIAENVEIMALKAVPDGDERDKDVALAVRYAVDNGAQIINMSFGKSFSPFKARVDEAFVYAAEKGVLIFHSAGNDSSNNDIVAGYPNRTVQDAKSRDLPEQIDTWLEIGASAKTKGFDLVASFSDYGKKDVDLFSPGALLNSTVPGNQYAVYSGTSMAGPAAAGVAALLMSNFPTMTALQAKAIILNQIRLYPGLLVRLPGSDKLDLPVPFANLSASEGIIDAYSSVRLAKQLSGL